MRTPFYSTINTIKEEDLRDIVKQFFDEKVPEYFWIVSASSTGKYHPDFSNGEGGLARHTIAALEIAEDRMKGMRYNRLPNELRDNVRAAIILHDAFKYGSQERYDTQKAEKGKSYTTSNHGIEAASEFFDFAKDKDIDFKRLKNICTGIETHMGVGEDLEGKRFPIIGQDDEDVVYLTQSADYLVSRKECRSVKAETLFKQSIQDKEK